MQQNDEADTNCFFYLSSGEWCAVKDEHLYVGGLGKEWTTPDGVVINFNPMFVKKIAPDGKVEHIDWHENYINMRKKAGIEFPGNKIIIRTSFVR